MATLVLAQPQWRYSLDGGPRPGRGAPEEPWLVEAAAQTYKAGAFVKLDGSGNVAVWDAGTNAQPHFGQAQRDATGVTGTAVKNVFATRRHDVFAMNLYHATAASAKTAITQVGVRYRVIVQAGIFCVDLANTTIEDATHGYPWVKVIGFADPANVGADIYGVALVVFGAQVAESDGGSPTQLLQGVG